MQFRAKEFCSSQLEYTQLLPAILFLDVYFWHIMGFLGLNTTNQRAKYVCLTCKFNLTEVTLLLISHGFDFPGWYTKRHMFLKAINRVRKWKLTVNQNFVTKIRKTIKWPRMCSKMAEGEDDFRRYYPMPNKMVVFLDFAGGTVDKNLPTDAGNSLIPGPGRFHMQRSDWAPFPNHWTHTLGCASWNYWSPCAIKPVLHRKRSHHNEKPV